MLPQRRVDRKRTNERNEGRGCGLGKEGVAAQHLPRFDAFSGLAVTTATLAASPQKTTLAIILAVAFCHGINDIMQSLLTAIYPILKASYGLDYVQLGILTLTFQCTASLLQPVIGIYTDKHPLPYSIA